MKSGIGVSSGGTENKVYVTMKIKRGEEIDPHLEIYRLNKDTGKYEITTDKSRDISGKFAGIDSAQYQPKKGGPKNKIIIYLINEDNNEIYVVQSAINGYARNIMNSFVRLVKEFPDDIDMLSFSVYKKTKNDVETANLMIRHYNPAINHLGEKNPEDGAMVGWYYDWDFQKEKITFKENDFNDYYQLEKFLFDLWLRAKKMFEENHPRYKRLLEEYTGSEVRESGYKIPASEETKKEEKKPFDENTPPGPDNVPPYLGEEEDDDLPF